MLLKRLLLVFITTLLAGALIFVPFPQLLTYERSSVVSTGVYWHGFGESGHLLDAHASYVKFDEDTQHLHICYQFDNVDSCQQYQVIKNKGVFAVVAYLL